nr:alanine and arginine-rich domain-containing protein [Manis javanica]
MSGKLRPRVSEMGPGQSGRRRAGTSWGPPGVSVRCGPCPPALRPARQVPGGSQSADVQAEAPASSRRLQDLRRRLLRAVQRGVPRGHWRRSQVQAAAAAAAAAREQEGRARVESALAGLHAELLEMHFQNLQLAKTLLDLDIKMEQLKKEYELEIASEFQSSEDNAGNLE